jgi:hypothetical protein
MLAWHWFRTAKADNTTSSFSFHTGFTFVISEMVRQSFFRFQQIVYDVAFHVPLLIF